ncbi:MAG: PEFG-CTERM sorting domain-containing protein [Thaumarchaeota archaeon]|nr:PEFG-CTERM sorting domain-containing protein [Nitrososphaerota archaeon]
MKITTTGTIFVFLAVMTGIIATPTAFADHAKATVSIPAGTSVPGCETTNECFIPAEVTVDVGGEVTWSNDDTAAHTVTSGDLTVDPDNVGTVFDSSLFMAGKTFSHKFDAAGEYPYFCMVHPWMVGTVIVQEAMAEEEEHMEEEHMEGMTMVEGMSADGTVKVTVSSGTPTAGEVLSLHVEFMDAATGDTIEHINYDITATQGGTTVLEAMGAHEHMASVEHATAALSSSDPVDVTVTILGIGLPGDEANWTGPMGDVVMFTVVPEFGTIAVMILGIAIVSIIAMTARSKIIPRI